jgi:alpha-ribazole phosphatase
VQLYLIRHPQPDIQEGMCYGASDLPLRDDKESLQTLAASLKAQLPENISVHTSPLKRCRLLAEALHPAPLHDARLREMNFGTWEMRAWTEIDRAELTAWSENPTGFTPPQGESVTQLQTRVHDFLAEQTAQRTPDSGTERQATAPLVLVTHAGVMKVIVGLAHGMTPAEWMTLKFDFGRVVAINLAASLHGRT